MVEKLNILLNAGVEMGTVTNVVACCGRIQVSGVSGGDEVFTLELTVADIKEAGNGRN